MGKSFSLIKWFERKSIQVYDLRPVSSSKISGKTLQFLSFAIQVPWLNEFIAWVVLWQLGLFRFRKYNPSGEPILYPTHPKERDLTKKEAEISIQEFIKFGKKKHLEIFKVATTNSKEVEKTLSDSSMMIDKMESIFDFHHAYLEGLTSPYQVAQRFLDIVQSMEESAVPMKPMMIWNAKEILHQGELSQR